MKNIRTVAETRILAAEAESRVRAGETFTSISSAMGIPTSTLADWARIGRWRRRDVKFCEQGELAGLAAAMSAIGGAAGVRLETKSADPSPGKDEPVDDDILPEYRAIAMAEILLERGQLDAADKAVRLATRFAQFRSRLAHAVTK